MSTSEPMRRVLQVHASRHCNLKCAHCYSWSHPQARPAVDAAHFLSAISAAAQLGYTNLSMSGGEPLLYPELGQLLRRAKDLGLSTSVISNGYLVSHPSFLTVADLIDTLVLSIDGEPKLHNRMRGSPRAFSMLLRAIQTLHTTQRPFGLIHTVTRENWNSLGWLISFASEHGARLLQLHPLEMAGRATETLLDSGLRPAELLNLFILTHLTGHMAAGTALQVDLTHVRTLRSSPETFYSSIESASHGGSLPTPLVIEEDGTVSPYVYGLHRKYALGNLQTSDLVSLIETVRRTGRAAHIDALCENVRRRLITRSRHPVVNWHEQLYRASHSAEDRVQLPA